jgi:hypothetical protein
MGSPYFLQDAVNAACSAALAVESIAPTYIAILPPKPAAGAASTVTVPAGVQWKIRGLKVTLGTSAVVITRTVGVSCSEPGGNQLVQAFSSFLHLASTAVAYSFAQGLLNMTAAIFFGVTNTMPEMVLGPGSTFTISVVNMQAADQLSNIAIMIEQTPVP